MPQQNIEKICKVAALALILLTGVAGVYTARGLYADGSFWLVEMLPRGGFFIFDTYRAYVQVLVQLPVVLAISLQVSDLNTLIRVHSFGFIGIPILFWLGALLLHMRSRLFWFFLMAFSVSFLRSNFFAAGEFSTAYSLTAICAAILLKPYINAWLALVLLAAALVLTHSYEATLFLGAFLAILSIIHLFKTPHESWGIKLCVLLAFFIFLAAVYVGADSTFFQRSYDGRGTANLGALKEIHLLYLILMPAVAAILCSGYGQRFEKLLSAALMLLAALYFIYSFRWDHSNISYGYLSYAYRALCSFLLLGVLGLAVLFNYWPKLVKSRPAGQGMAAISIGIFAFFVSMAWPLLYHTYGFYKWGQRFETQAITITEHTHIDKTSINTNHGWTFGYNWMWGNPSTSILLRGNAEAVILNNSTLTGWEPIDHTKIDKYPLQLNSKPPLTNDSPRSFEKRGLLYP
jgi:hypothetical protein